MSGIKRESRDSVDLDQIFNFDHNMFAASPAHRAKANNIQVTDFRSNALQQQQRTFVPTSQPSFSGPSFQYSLHTQQTGIPVGSLANSFAPLNSTVDLDFTGNDGGFDLPALPSNSGSNDTEMDFDSPDNDWLIDGSDSGFVDPNAIGGQEDMSPVQPRAEVVKFWPGMHTKQAELAKQQQLQQQQQQQAPKPVPSNASAHKRNGSKSNAYRHDPHVEHRISQLLNQMRRSSDGKVTVTAAAEGSESQTTNDNNNSQTTHTSSQSQSQSQSQGTRPKKNEDDMDDDERLLASEEGKKLSSKERRQLRNKVSARAFRSRRKEYIGQLESELSQKAQENDTLKSENEDLKAENNRLTDLTKMLLASPAFSGFVDELAANGIHTLPAALQAPKHEEQPQQQPAKPQQQQSQQQAPLATIPEQTIDFNAIAPAGGNWGTGIDFDFDQQVFAVTELPEMPTVDAELLSGKASSDLPLLPLPTSCVAEKNEMPRIEAFPQPEKQDTVVEQIEEEEDEMAAAIPALALFADAPSPAATKLAEPEYQLFGDIPLEKAFARIELTVEGEEEQTDGEVSAATMARFTSLVSAMDGVTERLASRTSHL